MVESWDGGGAVLATVTGWTGGSYLQLTGPFHLGLALGTATFQLSDGDDGTNVESSFQLSDGDDGTNVESSFRAIGVIESQLVERPPFG